MTPLPLCYYQKEDVISLAKSLLGKYLFTRFEDSLTGGIIVETEAYAGINDRASHAYKKRRTKRNESMYQKGGISYVYLCYGIHYLFNVVTNQKEIPHAILIRAIEPTHGIDKMLKRRKKSKQERSLTAGPGALTQALGIDLRQDRAFLNSQHIYITQGEKMKENDIICSPRVGISYAKEDALLPWRFRIRNNLWTSLAK